jgi:AraC-like DNA-binding protein
MVSKNNKNITDNPSLKVAEIECVRVGPVSAIPALLREYADEPPEQILAEVGLDLGLFEDPDNSISFVDVGRLFDLCVKRTRLPHFGLLVGQQANPASLGQLAELAVHAPTVGSALYRMILHICIHDRGGVPTLSTNNGFSKMGYAVYIPMHVGIGQVCDASLAITYNLLRSLCGETWAPSKVLFSHSQPSDIKPYESFYQAPLTFEAEEDAFVFPEHWLHQPLPGADIQKHNMVVERLTTIESGMGVDLAEEVRSILRPLIISRTCSPEQIARALSIHPRTLNRRLKDNGTTLREIAGEIRYEISKQLLADSTTSLINISTLLGYSDASVFTHAFRRWSGSTPSDWRNEHTASYS